MSDPGTLEVPRGLVAIDGVLVDRRAATVSVYDRGFLYGDSVFETMRTYSGLLFRLDDHMRRLARSLEIVGMGAVVDVASLGQEVAALTTEARLRLTVPGGSAPEMTSRVMVSRGEGPLGLLPPAGLVPRRVLFLEPCVMPSVEAYEDGVDVVTVPTFRPSDAARGAKVGNYLESVLALSRAKDKGAVEALIVDGAGFVIEGTTSNVFGVRDGRLVTPPATSTLLPGITRRTVFEIAADRGMSLEERNMSPEELAAMDEVFITSTVREILPARRVDGRALPTARPVTRALREAFRRRVELPARSAS